MNAGQFIKQKTQEVGLSLPEVAERCRIGRGTIYRYVRNEYPIPATVEEQLGAVLNLTKAEKSQLRSLIEDAQIHRPMRKAFEIIDKLVFDEGSAPRSTLNEGVVLLLDKDRYVLSMDELCDRMLRHADKPEFTCCLRFAQGIGELFFEQIEPCIMRLLEAVPGATVEHLVSSPRGDATKNIQLAVGILPFLQYRNYKVFYTEEENLFEAQRMFSQSFYFSTSFIDEGVLRGENFMYSVRNTTEGACFCSSDPLFHEFVTGEFYDIRKQYHNDLQAMSTFNVGLDFFADLESNYPSAILNPDFHITHIPSPVISEKLRGLDEATKQSLADSQSNKPVKQHTVDARIETMIASIERRRSFALQRPQTSICSKEGLLAFVQTGRRCDHLKWVPPYTKDEMRRILEDVRDRNLDDSDEFRFYLTDMPILANGYTLEAYLGHGIAVQYNQKPERARSDNYLFMTHSFVADVLYRYLTEYLPATHVISQDETTAYLNHLIETYLT